MDGCDAHKQHARVGIWLVVEIEMGGQVIGGIWHQVACMLQ
jgi:hypothetical protein